MASKLYPDAQLEALRGFPAQIAADDLARYFTLLPADTSFINAHRGDGNRIGVAVALCTLAWLGFVPDDLRAAPAAAVSRVAAALGVPKTALARYAARSQTRTEHLREVAAFLGWRTTTEVDAKELDQFLLARAMEHDAPSVLFELACEHLRGAQLIRPGPVWLVQRVAAAREAAKAQTFVRLEHLLTPQLIADLDGLLNIDDELGSTRLSWLGNGATQPSPGAIKTEIAKLAYLRRIGADELDLSALPTQRSRFLAETGRRSTAQMLARRDPARRYPILLTLVGQSAIDVRDEVVQLFDQAVSGRESHAKHKLAAALAGRAVAAEDRLALLDDIVPTLLDPLVPDEAVGAILRGLGLARIRAAHAMTVPRLPRDHGHLGMLHDSFSYLRQFVPHVLDAVTFEGGQPSGDLITALEILKTLYTKRALHVPDGAPTSFVPTRWLGYLDKAAADADAIAYRHYWELCVLYGIRDGLRSGDVYVPGSRRYANPMSHLIPHQPWDLQRGEFCQLVSKPADGPRAVKRAAEELDTALGELEAVLVDGSGSVRLDDTGELVVGKLPAQALPNQAEQFLDQLVAMLPRIPLASLLIELDARTGFTDHLVHASGKQARSPQLVRNLIACLIASATNMGLTAMSEASGIPYDVLAWTAQWYLREDTLRAANTVLVNHHYQLPMAAVFGSGTLSSSDGQRFPMRGKSLTARHLSRYFVGEGISTYTHVSDQHTIYGTKIVVATDREAHYVLDEILGNTTDLPITEHATDTHGVTLVNFALFDLLGKTLSPRIRDLKGIVLHRMGPRSEYHSRYPHAGPLLTGHADLDLIASQWDDMLRLAGSIKFGHATASLLVSKLCASSRQNTLAAALKEWGAIRRTIYACRYLSDTSYQRKISGQLNKGESLHALRRDIHYARLGQVTKHHTEQQTEQAWCLTLVTNAIVAWMTEYLGLAVDVQRSRGISIPNEVLAHISPARSEPVQLFGTIAINVDEELARLDPTGHRPLRHSDHLA